MRYELVHEVVWDGTRSGSVGSVEANMDLFCKPEYAKEEDTCQRIVVRRRSSRDDILNHHWAVLAAMGADWTRPGTVARRIGRTPDSVWLSMRRLVEAGKLEQKYTAPEYSRLRGATWYRRRAEES